MWTVPGGVLSSAFPRKSTREHNERPLYESTYVHQDANCYNAILMTLSKIGTMKLVSEKKMLNLSERNSMK